MDKYTAPLELRAWSKNFKKWITFNGQSCTAITGDGEILLLVDDNLIDRFSYPPGISYSWQPASKIESKDLIIVQYTGLKDKNKKKIFGGDILDCDGLAIIKYIIDGYWFVDPLNNPIRRCVDPENWEIRGNVFENPKLIK